MRIADENKVVHDEANGIDRRVFAGQPIPPDLVQAYDEAGGKTTQDPGPVAGPGQEVATRTVTVHNADLGIDQRLFAGQPVPADLLDVYHETIGGHAEGAKVDYDEQSADDLHAEADRRGLDVTGTGASGNVVKADLVAALAAYDADGE